MMRHKVKCPRDDITNEGCQLLHDPNHLDELLRHVQYEVFEKKNPDLVHRNIRIDPAKGFVCPEDDLKHLYQYKKNYYDDLEAKVRKRVFKMATAAVPFLVKDSRARPRLVLDSKTGWFSYQLVQDEDEETSFSNI